MFYFFIGENMLTEKQYKLLMFINKVTKETGCCPSFDEMKEAVNLKSKSGIHALIEALVERNFLKKTASQGSGAGGFAPAEAQAQLYP